MQTELRNRKKLAPARLAEKLLTIRRARGLNQSEMLQIINPFEKSGNNRARVSQYERSQRVPSLVEIQNYADLIQISVDLLTNDQLDLPPDIQNAARLNEEKQREKALRRQKSRKVNRKVRAGGKKRHGVVYYAAATATAAAVPPAVKGRTKVPVPPPESNPPAAAPLLPETAEAVQTVAPPANEPPPLKNDHAAGNAQEIAPAADGRVSPVAEMAAAPTNAMRLSEETARLGKPVYLALLGELPFSQMVLFSSEKFIELAVGIVANDFHAHGTESAIAHRVRLLIEAAGGS